MITVTIKEDDSEVWERFVDYDAAIRWVETLRDNKEEHEQQHDSEN